VRAGGGCTAAGRASALRGSARQQIVAGHGGPVAAEPVRIGQPGPNRLNRMDPICHTLVGATLAATGLEKQTRYGRPTLIVAANLPDIDAVVHAWGYPATYAFRRGITHGLPAIVVLPVLLVLLVIWVDRIRPPTGDRRRADPGWLLALAAIGVATHPSLDWLNNYGMRWLMPAVDRWYYGDTLFIVDWVAWAILALALCVAWLLRRRVLSWYARPAVIGIAALLAYIGMNAHITAVAEHAIWAALADRPPQRLMASPVPLNPFARDVVIDYGNAYRFADYRHFGRPTIVIDEQVIEIGDRTWFERAGTIREGRWFLHWARFPYVVAERKPGRLTLKLGDARYVRDIDSPRLRNFGVLELDFRVADNET